MNIVWGRPPVRLWRKGLNGRLVKNTMATWIMVGGLLFYFLIVGCSCNDDGVGPQATAQLRAEDIGVTDVWLKVTVDTGYGNFEVKRDKNTVIATLHAPTDTIITDSGLLPKHTYTYTAGASTPITITTMDTTSHNFTWQIDTLGDGASSTLYDVAIINDTLAYAVGEINIKDSLGNWEPSYGLAKWNGHKWKLQRLYALSPTGNYYSNLRPHGIFIFSETDIWFANGGVFHWNGHGEYVTPYWINSFPGNPNAIFTQGQGAEKLWGSSDNNLYVVGTKGAIAHFDGSTWKKIESGTISSINDIYGIDNGHNVNRMVLCTVSNVVDPGDQNILRFSSTNNIEAIPWNTGRDIGSIWFLDTLRLFTAGGGVFERKPNKKWYEITSIPLYYTRRIRGHALNDIVVVGDFGLVAHGNGSTWRTYPEVAAALYYSCDYNVNIVMAVGGRNSRAVILRGYKH